jgi:signal peptidase I
LLRSLIRTLLLLALLCGAVVGGLRATAIRWWRVPDTDPYLEASIAPTLRGGDLVILWRLTKPKFGDLVLCPEPKAPDRVVVGRLVGESGDKITITGDKVRVNAHTASEERRCSPPTFTTIDPDVGNEVTQSCSVEALGGHLHLRGSTAGHLAPRAVTHEVGEGQAYLVSDNRLFPYDSRDYGPVERISCKETVVFRLFPKEGPQAEGRFTFIQ